MNILHAGLSFIEVLYTLWLQELWRSCCHTSVVVPVSAAHMMAIFHKYVQDYNFPMTHLKMHQL